MPEVLPEFVYVVGLFFAVVGYVAARGLLATWTHSVGYLLAWLGAKADISVPYAFGHINVPLGAPFRAADSFVVTALQEWANGAEIEMGYCLHGMEKFVRYTAEAIDYLARETSVTFDWLAHVRLPKWAKWVTTVGFPVALVTRLIAHAVTASIAHGIRGARVIVRTDTAALERYARGIDRTLRKDEKAIAKVAAGVALLGGAIALDRPGGISVPWPSLRAIRKELAAHAKWLHRLEAATGVAAFAALMANVLGLPNWRCLTRGNVGRTARALCGIPAHLLNDLLGLIVDFFVLSDICEVIPLLEKGFSVIEEPLTELVSAAGMALCHGDYNGAPEIGPLELSLPPVTGYTLSAV